MRDKDGVDAAFMICEMFAYYKTRGISLLTKLEQIQAEYGCCLNTLHSYAFEGSTGMHRMQAIMADLRRGVSEIGGLTVKTIKDYLLGLENLPSSNVLKYGLESGCSVVIRPSGTEPKLKVYLSVTGKNKTAAELLEKRLTADLERRIHET